RLDVGDLIILGSYTGLRINEANSLRWEDVHLGDERSFLTVEGQVYGSGTDRRWEPLLKRESSRRLVPLTPAAVDLLQARKGGAAQARPGRLPLGDLPHPPTHRGASAHGCQCGSARDHGRHGARSGDVVGELRGPQERRCRRGCEGSRVTPEKSFLALNSLLSVPECTEADKPAGQVGQAGLEPATDGL